VRVGVFGGTFNPPHLGHLVCAQEALLTLDLDRVLFMPAARPPHKPVPDDPGPAHRLQLCRLAVGGERRMEVSDLEVTREGTSFTVDTLEQLSAISPDNELFLILGGDQAAGLPSWREPERICSLATLAVAGRKGTPETAVTEALAHVRGGDRVQFFPMPTVEISSTMIRERAAAGLSIRYFVPCAVERYVTERGLYREVSR
jgi:nicotinate-nucleotide adenylyltransferase